MKQYQLVNNVVFTYPLEVHYLVYGAIMTGRLLQCPNMSRAFQIQTCSIIPVITSLFGTHNKHC